MRLFLFGAPRVEFNGQTVPLRRTKALALLAYLVVTRQPQEREALLALFWPEFDEASARNNLRRELSLLKTMLGEDALVADRFQIAWSLQVDAWLDIAAFQAHLAIWRQHRHLADALCAECAATLETAVQLYREDFLAGFGLPDSPAFDEWQFFVREGLRQQLAQALQALCGWYSRRGEFEPGLAYARRWLALDRLHEPAQRELMRLYAWAGQHSGALRQYDECVRLLHAELGAEPEPETTELYEAIKARRLASPAIIAEPAPVVAAAVTIPASEPPSPRRQHQAPLRNLPPLPAGFVGRQRELADLLRRLTDPDCRLLTLVGPGGIGKTRLALRAAQILADEWTGQNILADGILFVPLAAVDTLSGLVSALAAAACFEFYPNVPPDQQVLDYFRTKRMLIVLDNFEQLLDAVEFVGELLATAPGLRLLITSRAALNLRDEWFHPIEGLSFPTATDDISGVAQLGRFDAVRLFEQHARRVRGNFSLSRARQAVVRLCQLVEGMPLAIELAAAWLKLLSVEQVVAALEPGLDILTARDKQIPDRHRSMRAVLEETWRLLSADEQRTFARLTVFSGGFSAEAAASVVNASLNMLATLVDKSLLRSGADGRFQLHELLRQFAAEKLVADEQLAHTTHARHSAYYLAILAEREARLLGPDQRAALVELDRLAANMWAAWRWAIEHDQFESVDHAVSSCFHYYVTRSYYQEGERIFSLAASIAPNRSAPTDAQACERLRARALIRRGAFRYFLGDYESATQSIESGLIAAENLDLPPDIGYAYQMLGLIGGWRGNMAIARQHLGEALRIGRATGDQPLVAEVLHDLALLTTRYGDYAERQRLAQESLAIGRSIGRSDLTARSLRVLAWSEAWRGEYQAAEAHFRESLELIERIGSAFGVSLALNGIGWVAFCAGGARLQEAREYIERSLEIVRTIGHRRVVTDSLADLALIAIDSGDYEQAGKASQEGLALARALGIATYTTQHLGILGHVAAARQEFGASRRYLREALQTASAGQLWPYLALTLYHVAVLFAGEAAFVGVSHPGYAARKARALELLASIADHSAVSHVYQVRARRLIDELRRDLPPDLVEAVIARGERLELQASATTLIDELARPPLAQSSGVANQLAPPLPTSFAA